MALGCLFLYTSPVRTDEVLVKLHGLSYVIEAYEVEGSTGIIAFVEPRTPQEFDEIAKELNSMEGVNQAERHLPICGFSRETDGPIYMGRESTKE
jgi:DNA-binding Lrp family transcriptional regulator